MKKKKMNSWIQNILLNDKRTPIQQFPLISTEKGVMYIEGYEQKYKFTFKVLEMCWYGFLSKTPTIKTKTHTHKKKKAAWLNVSLQTGNSAHIHWKVHMHFVWTWANLLHTFTSRTLKILWVLHGFSVKLGETNILLKVLVSIQLNPNTK